MNYDDFQTSLPDSASLISASVGPAGSSSSACDAPGSISNRLVISCVIAVTYAGETPINIASSDSYVVDGYCFPVVVVAETN